ncbi:hypothetical protein [Streptomyces sp. NPDC048392]|uniref:hypothetical protein n=1 Tax=Streptomyces sp. NPDC048392 TaxID=3365543 RepID=UPI003712FB7B
MTVTRYRKLPVEVDTIQWTGSNEAEVQAFTGSANFHALDDASRENSDDPAATATVYDKLHSTWVLVYIGQHIVRGVKGEYYPIAEDVLAETYEPAPSGPPEPSTAEPHDRERTHIKAMIEVLKEETPKQLVQPAGLFISGMLTGLAATVQVLDGSTAEQAMEAIPTKLEAAIGRAFLSGTLPTAPPKTDPVDVLRQIDALLQDLGVEGDVGARGVATLANTVRAMREELQRAENFEGRAKAYEMRAADRATRIDCLIRGRDQLRERLAEQEAETMRQHERAQQAEAAIARVRALHRPADHRGLLICVECSGYDGSGCDNSPCGYEHCPTLRALAKPSGPAATEAPEPELTAEEARTLADDLGIQLYDAQDALAFVEECCAIADREQRAISTTDVREWLKGARCGRLLAAEQHATETTARVDWQALAERRERELKTVGEGKHTAEQERDGAYRERAHLVALLAAMTDGAVIAPDVDETEEPGWQIVYLTIGGRRASWHISPRDLDLFTCVPHVDAGHPLAQWDGHTTEDKYAGIRQHTLDLFHQCGPACAEGHTYTGRCEGAHQADDSDTTAPDVVHPATEPQASNPQAVDE